MVVVGATVVVVVAGAIVVVVGATVVVAATVVVGATVVVVGATVVVVAARVVVVGAFGSIVVVGAFGSMVVVGSPGAPKLWPDESPSITITSSTDSTEPTVRSAPRRVRPRPCRSKILALLMSCCTGSVALLATPIQDDRSPLSRLHYVLVRTERHAMTTQIGANLERNGLIGL